MSSPSRPSGMLPIKRTTTSPSSHIPGSLFSSVASSSSSPSSPSPTYTSSSSSSSSSQSTPSSPSYAIPTRQQKSLPIARSTSDDSPILQMIKNSPTPSGRLPINSRKSGLMQRNSRSPLLRTPKLQRVQIIGNYQFISDGVLGCGQFGKVKLALHIPTNEKVRTTNILFLSLSFQVV